MAEGYQQAISPQTLASISAHLRQVRASGRPVTEADIRAAYQAALQVEADKSLEGRRFAAQQEQWDKTYKLQKKQMENQERAATISGVATVGTALYNMGGKEAIKGLWNKTGIGGAQTQTPSSVVGGTATGGVAKAPAVTGASVPSNPVDAGPVSSPSVGGGEGITAQGTGTDMGEFATDWVLPGVAGAGVGYGVKALTGSTAAGVAAGAGLGALAGFFSEGDVVGGIVGGLMGGVGGLF